MKISADAPERSRQSKPVFKFSAARDPFGDADIPARHRPGLQTAPPLQHVVPLVQWSFRTQIELVVVLSQFRNSSVVP